jgi:hypothetical protein
MNLDKQLKFLLEIHDLKNSNLNSVFGHVGINYIKALNILENNLLSNIFFKSGTFYFICFYNKKKEFDIKLYNINFSYVLKQFFFFLFLKKKLLDKNNYKNFLFKFLNSNENFLLLQNLKFNIKKKIKNINIKDFFIIYLFFIKYIKKKRINLIQDHFLNINFLKNFLKNLCLKNDPVSN